MIRIGKDQTCCTRRGCGMIDSPVLQHRARDQRHIPQIADIRRGRLELAVEGVVRDHQRHLAGAEAVEVILIQWEAVLGVQARP